MPGVDLNLDLPSLSDTLATIVAKVAVALQAIEDDLAAQVTTAELDINADLSMEGSRLTNVRSLHFNDGYGTPFPSGSLGFDGGELYAMTSSGLVRLTLSGSVDAGSVGGITGMGSTSASVVFDVGSGEFRFFEDVGDYADLRAEDVILTNTSGGSVRLGVNSAITTARTLDIKSLPTSGISLLAYNSATSTLEDAATAGTITHALTFSGVVTASDFKHGSQSVSQAPHLNVQASGGTFSFDTSGAAPESVAGSGVISWHNLVGCKTGDRITAVTASGSDLASVAPSFNVYIRRANTGSGEVTVTPSRSGAAFGPFTYTLAFDTPYTLTAGDAVWLKITSGAGSTDWRSLGITFDRP